MAEQYYKCIKYHLTVVLEKTLQSPLDCKKIQPVHPKGNQSWILIGKTDAQAETAIHWPPDAKNLLIGKDPDAGKDWGQEKGMAEDEMVGWHHRLHGHEFEQAPGVNDSQGSLACCNPWGHKELDTTESLNWTENRQEWQIAFSFLAQRIYCLQDLLLRVWASEWKKESEVIQSCPTLCNPTDCNLPGSSDHGIFQAIVLQ